MKAQADKQRTEREFQEGDYVFLKLQPYVQSTVANRSNQKLSFRFYGPYKIVQHIGKVAYKLELPPGSRIHLVVHVSQLKRHIPADYSLTQDLSTVGTDPFKKTKSVCMLDNCVILRGASLVPQRKIQWDGLSSGMATWEDEYYLKEFPEFKA
jgi:ribosomal protein L21E